MPAPTEPVEVAAFLDTPPVHHDHWTVCHCGFHQHMRAVDNYDGPTPDDHDMED